MEQNKKKLISQSEDRISEEQIEAVRELANLNDAIILNNLGFSLERDGSVRCACPIHGGDNNGAFTYNARKKIWRCWTNNCQEEYGAGLIGLVKAVKRFGFVESLQYIIELCQNGMQDNEVDFDALRINAFLRQNENESINIPYPKDILKDFDHQVEYFLKRDFRPETLSLYQTFYCSNENKPLYGRACIPLFDENNNLIGFNGRATEILETDRKWDIRLHNFHKELFLFNLNNAKEYIQKTKTAIIVEGALDSMRLWEAGIKNAVSLFGVYMSYEQIKLLIATGTKKIILMLDPDAAGSTATQKLMDKLTLYFKVEDWSKKLSIDPGKMSVDDITSKLPELIGV